MWYRGNGKPVVRETAVELAKTLEAEHLFRFKNVKETDRVRFRALRSELCVRYGYNFKRVGELSYRFTGIGLKYMTIELDELSGTLMIAPKTHALKKEVHELFDLDIRRIPYQTATGIVKWAVRYAWGVQLFGTHTGVHFMPIEDDYDRIARWIEESGFGKVFSCMAGSDIFEAVRERYAEVAEQDLRRERVRFTRWMKAGRKDVSRWQCWRDLLEFFEARHLFFVSQIGEDDVPTLLPGIKTMRGWLDGHQDDLVSRHTGDGEGAESR